MWWPGTVPAGTTCSEPAMTIDILPTVAELCNAELPEHKIDGKSILPLVKGEPGANSPQEAYFMYYGRELQAVRMGKWKLHFPHDYRTLAGRPGGTGGTPVNYSAADIELSLFDLENDIGETTNLAGQHPDVVARIKQLADEMRADLGDSRTQQQGSGVRPPGRI
jgi:arylsulfatase A